MRGLGFGTLVAEDRERGLIKLDGDFGDAFGEALTGADVERDTGPAPVFNEESRRGVGVGVGVGIDAGFLAEAGDVLTADAVGAVLAGHGVAPDLFRGHGLDG